MERASRRLLSILGIFLFAFIYGMGAEFYDDHIKPALLTPTRTPRVTATSYYPATITLPASVMGVPIHYRSLEITLVGAIPHDLIYTGNNYAWYPLDGDRIIDLAVRVNNSSLNDVHVNWENVGVIESNGESWFAYFGNTKVTTNPDFDPFGVKITETTVDEFIFIGSATTYMRLIFFVSDSSLPLLFQIESSPLIEFKIK